MSTTDAAFQISFVPEKIIPFTIQVDRRSYHEFVPFDQRIQAWQVAIEQLEKDVNDAAEHAKGSPFPEYHWSYTTDNHRNDGVLGTIYLYYMTEILKKLKALRPFSVVHSELTVPSAFCLFLRSVLGIRVSYSIQKRLASSFDWRNGDAIKAFARVAMLIFNTNVGKPVVRTQSKGRVLVASSRNRFSNRYDHVAGGWDKNVLLYHKKVEQQLRVEGYESANAVGLLSAGLIFHAKIDSIRIVSSLRRCFNENSLFSYFVHRQSYFQVVFLRLRQLLTLRLFKQLAPSRVFYSGSVSDPDQKLTVMIANQLRIPVTVVACRPGLSEFRPEDRIISAELRNVDHLPTSFIVKDGFSKETLSKHGFNVDKIDVKAHAIQADSEVNSFDDCLLILFTQYDVNTNLVRLVATAKPEGFKKVLLRSHPNRRSIHALDERQFSFIRKFGLPVQDITDLSWGQVAFRNSVAIGANSTAMLEAASRGCGLVWLPFLTDLSIQYFPLMQKLGSIAMNEEQFDLQLNELRDPSTRCSSVEQCVQSYQTHFN